MDAEESLLDFTRQAWPIIEPGHAFVDGWHIGAIAEHLEACSRGQIRKLIINVPPRSTKSLNVCVFWPAWTWTTHAATQWLFSSYGQHLSTRDSIKCRDLIRSDWYQGNWGDKVCLKEDQNAKTWFKNTATGYRLATSVGGIGTGEGGDYIVTDDPHNVVEIESDTERESVIYWWENSMAMRGNDPNTVCHVVVMQRLHAKDLTGHLLERGGYEHLMIPMEYDPKRSRVTSIGWKDPRAEEGELLCPERFNQETVGSWKQDLGAAGTAGQLNQRPVPPGGALFKDSHFLYFEVVSPTAEDVAERREIETPWAEKQEPRIFVLHLRNGQTRRVWASDCWWFQTCDTAMKTGQSNDYTVVTTFAVTPENDLLVYDVWREKIEMPKQYDALIVLRQRYPNLTYQAVEDKVSGIGIIQQGAAAGVPFKALKPDADKVRRATAVATSYENGKVFHRQGAPWQTVVEDELLTFPNGAHDDVVDTIAYGGLCLLEAGFGPRVREDSGVGSEPVAA